MFALKCVTRESNTHTHTHTQKQRQRERESMIEILPSWSITLVLIFVWYLCGVATVTSSKQIVSSFPFPLCLCAIQFTFASIVTLMYLHVKSARKPTSISSTTLVMLTAASYSLGFVFLTASMEFGKRFASICFLFHIVHDISLTLSL